MNSSESIAKLSAALVAAQTELANAHKDATNPHYGSTFASLPAVIDATRPTLNRHGLAVLQLPGYDDGVATIETILTHSSGEWISGVSGAPVQKKDPQGVGSAITYLRRYSLAALCGIGQDDDDGTLASQKPIAKSTSTEAKRLAKELKQMLDANRNLPEAGKRAALAAFTSSDVDRMKAGIAWIKEQTA